MAVNNNNKIGLVVAPQDFKDEEYFTPRLIFEEIGYKPVTICSRFGPAVSTKGKKVNVDVLAKNFQAGDFAAVVFVGGSGAQDYIDNKLMHQIIEKSQEKGLIIGAICIAPAILARSGLLEGKKATVFPSDKGINELEKGGANYLEEKVVVDDNIVTAKSPQESEKFAQQIVKLLK